MLLAVAVGIARWPYPFLPRHLTIVSSLTIGIPAFFLALAPEPAALRAGLRAARAAHRRSRGASSPGPRRSSRTRSRTTPTASRSIRRAPRRRSRCSSSGSGCSTCSPARSPRCAASLFGCDGRPVRDHPRGAGTPRLLRARHPRRLGDDGCRRVRARRVCRARGGMAGDPDAPAAARSARRGSRSETLRVSCRAPTTDPGRRRGNRPQWPRCDAR